MSLQKALKYAISRKKFEILRMLKLMLGKTDENNESESDDDNESESDSDGYEILKKLAPTVVDRESEMSESNDEHNGESENDNVSTDKEKCSKPYNPYSEYYENQARPGQVYKYQARTSRRRIG